MAEDGDNIADSWEEIDENQIFNGVNAQEPVVKPAFYPSGPIVIQGEDALRSQYLPPEPLVKILKRPSKQERDSLALKTNGATLAKSLKQREVEYAEARLRIMGTNSDDSLYERLERLEAPSSSINSSSSNGPSSTSSNVTYTLLRPTERLEPNLLRLPRGPDGTPGFTLRR